MSASARPRPADAPADAVQPGDRHPVPASAADTPFARAPQRSSTLSFGLEVTPYDVLAKAMDRSAGAPRIDDNHIRLNFDGPHTFARWIDAIEGASRFVHFENYVLRDDTTGRAFRDVLVAKAEEGLEVRVLYDWVGCWATSGRYWKPFREKGVQVRAFNPPGLRDPFGVLQRDHRKLVCVDGEVAFVGGFCVGDEWAGTRDHAPWRDTGAELRGPAALAAARAFARLWDEIGDPVPASLLEEVVPVAAGRTPVWVIEGRPWRARVYRVTQLAAASVRRRLWITDPYFIAPRPVAEALAAAARDGVDVRILVPAHNNWPLVGSLARGGYRDLLKAGVRLFEWQGPMIHAKTAVADGVWSRIGSSNLNAASLLGNWEIDIGVLDRKLARQLEGLFLADLASSIEIVLPSGRPARAARPPAREPEKRPIEPPERLVERLEHWRHSPDRGGWRISDLVRAGSTLGDAIAGRRLLEREARTVLGTTAGILIGLALLAAFFPRTVAWTFAVLLGWLGVTAGARAWVEARRARSGPVSGEPGQPDIHPAPASDALPQPENRKP